jgi:TatD DNase family protein
LLEPHCHLAFAQFAGDIDAVVERSRAAGVTGWVTIGTNTQENRKAVELAGRFENMYATVGIHPHYAQNATADDFAEMKRLAQNQKVVAIGETGLDFHYAFSKQNDQKRVFAEQLELARQMNLPVVVHSRDAFDDTIEILDRFGEGVKRVVFHCFGGSAEQARIVIEKGFYISFTGAVTFKNAENLRQVAALVPLGRLMVETDCPYMSPEPMRKQKINEPALMVHTVKRLAELKEMDLADFVDSVTAVSRNFFDLPQK